VHGSTARNLSIELPLSQTSKNTIPFFFSLQQNRRTRGQNRFCPEAEGAGWKEAEGGGGEIA
jgi:hypothetical protein